VLNSYNKNNLYLYIHIMLKLLFFNKLQFVSGWNLLLYKLEKKNTILKFYSYWKKKNLIK